MAEILSIDGLKTLTDVGFSFVFGIVALYGAGMLAKYIAHILDKKDIQLIEERKAREELSMQVLNVVNRNTDGFKEMVMKLTDFMQEGRVHHSSVMSQLVDLKDRREGFTQKALRKRG
jgi:hypothetical protein